MEGNDRHLGDEEPLITFILRHNSTPATLAFFLLYLFLQNCILKTATGLWNLLPSEDDLKESDCSFHHLCPRDHLKSLGLATSTLIIGSRWPSLSTGSLGLLQASRQLSFPNQFRPWS